MENGTEIIDGSREGERKRVENGVPEETAVGSDEVKDLDGEEVFEEAIDAEEHFHEQGIKYHLSDADVGKGNNFETVGTSDSGFVDENPDAGLEIEDFEEAISTPVAAGNHWEGEAAVIADNKVDVDGGSINIVQVNGIDSGGTKHGVVTNEFNGFSDDQLVDGENSGGKDVPGFNAGAEIGVWQDQSEVDVTSDLVGDKSENEISENLISEHTTSEEFEKSATGNVETGFIDSHLESQSNREILNEDSVAEESKGNVLSTEYNDDEKTENSLNAEEFEKSANENGEKGVIESQSNREILNEDSVAEDSKENVLSTEFNDDEKTENLLNGDTHPEFQEDEGAELNGSSVNTNTEHQSGKIRDFKDETNGIDITSGDGSSEEIGNVSGYVSTKWQDYTEDDEPNGVKAGHEKTFEEENTSSGLCVSVEERETTPSVESSLLSENSPINETHNIQAAATNSKEENDKGFQLKTADEEIHGDNDKFPQAAATNSKENDKGSQLKTADEEIPGDNNKFPGVVEPLKIEEKNLKENQSSRVGHQDIQPEPELASSSAKSASSAPPPARPAGLGRAAPLLEPVPRVVQQPRVNGAVSHTQNQQVEDATNGEAEEFDETREHLQMIRVKFLRLAHRLGQTPHNVVVAQVLYRLGLAEQLRGRNGGRVGAFSFDRASAMAEQLEAAGQDPLDFSCTIMVLGKSGVGKSATINSIFDEVKFSTDAFQMGTKKVQDVEGTVQGIKVRVIDTPGLLPSWSDQRQNEKILLSVRRFIKKTPPDIVLYLDRLDMQSRDFGDMPLLRTITEIFGPSIWFNAIVVLTHAASAPPDGPNGTASSYDMFVTQRSHVVQQAIRQAAGDMRLMNPVSLVENHSACRTNRAGQRVLPNGQVWKPHLLLLSFASKILAEANTLLKLHDSPTGKPFAARARAPPLPFLLSSLLQSRPQLKLPEEQYGDEDSLDDDLDESSDSDDESELDELPPFRRLTKAQLEKLSKAQKKAYFDELEYREKLFMKKQLKEERKRRKIMKKMAASAKELQSDYSENVEEDSGGAASVPVPMPDLALPASFDSDNPTHRYRCLDSSNQWLVRPVLETHGWDHDVGYEGINAERLFVVKDKIPFSFSGQVTKDKKDANVQMELASSIKHGEGKATSLGFDLQTVGKDLAYTLRSETRFSNYRRNEATAGLSFTLLGDALSAGVKVEDKLIANKRFKLVLAGGAMTGRGDVAYGGSLEAQLRDKDYPLGRSLSTLGISVMDWHGDLAIGCNVQSQIPLGRSTNLIARANVNNRGAGQVSIRLNSSEQLQLALVGLIPLLRKLVGYSPQLQFGQ